MCMVLMVQPIADALKSVRTENSHVVLMTPQGNPFNQAKAHAFKQSEHLILICGHYEGFDERIRSLVDEEISIGDYVLTGGEIGAMAVSDAVFRLCGNVIRSESHEDDSLEIGLLEYPQYTSPVDYEGQKVPEVLLSGHHANIRRWRLKESLRKTYLRRPELLQKRSFTKEESTLFNEILAEMDKK